jgi:hypothetical protein
MMNKFLERAKFFLNQILDLITDLLVPFVDLLIAVATLLPIPQKYLDILKKGEHYLKQIGDTVDKVEDEVAKRIK